MNLPMLAVDKDVMFANNFQTEWQKRGIPTVRVDNMQEAMEKLAAEPFLCAGINADSINYLPLLKVMAEVSLAPILILTSNFTVRDQTEAILHGADGYIPFAEDIRDNVDSAIALLQRIGEQNRRTQKAPAIISHGDLLVLPAFRQAFQNGRELKLTKVEFNLLCYFMNNCGVPLTYQQIFENVWGSNFENHSFNSLWCQIRELRKKLTRRSGGDDYITTLRKVGYKFNLC